METLRKFIGKRYIEAQSLTGTPLEVARRQATDASNALDLIGEQLRQAVAKQSERV